MVLFLRAFLTEFLGEECIEIDVEWKCDKNLQLGLKSSKADTTICIDHCMVHLASVIEASDDNDLDLFLQAAHEIDDGFEFSSGRMELHTFLAVGHIVYRPALYKQILGQLGKHIDAILPERWSGNPLEIIETAQQTPPRSRRDVQLGEHLAMGSGACGSGRATHTAQHIRSFVAFQPVAKRMRNLTVREIDDGMLLKIVQANEEFWPQVQHLSCGSDGVRVCSKDVVYFLFSGAIEDVNKNGWHMKVAHI
jgi:hypothetical protein